MVVFVGLVMACTSLSIIRRLQGELDDRGPPPTKQPLSRTSEKRSSDKVNAITTISRRQPNHAPTVLVLSAIHPSVQPRLNHPSCRIQERFRLNHPPSVILQLQPLLPVSSRPRTCIYDGKSIYYFRHAKKRLCRSDKGTDR